MAPTNLNWNDDDTWLELASGRLDAATLRELVAACDQQPALWKRCALALLEEQVLEQELQVLKGSALGEAGDRAPALTSGSTACSPSTSAIQLEPKPTARRANQAAWMNNLALVASVMVAFMIGWQASQRWGTDKSLTSPAPLEQSNTLAESPASERGTNNPFVDSGVQTEFASLNSEIEPDEIERVNKESLVSAIEFISTPERRRHSEQLRKQGYKVQTQVGAVPVILPDGRRAIVPIEQLQIQPKYQIAY